MPVSCSAAILFGAAAWHYRRTVRGGVAPCMRAQADESTGMKQGGAYFDNEARRLAGAIGGE
jgi:hypothetical protein